MPPPEPKTALGQYVELAEELEIRFTREGGVTLNDIGIVSDAIHRMLNTTMGRLSDIWPFQFSEEEFIFGPPPYRIQRFDPALVQAHVTGLSYESFSIKTALWVPRVLKDFLVQVSAGVVVVLLTTCSNAKPEKAEVKSSIPVEVHAAPIDVGPNIEEIAERLSKTGGEWELYMKDPKTGAEVRISRKK